MLRSTYWWSSLPSYKVRPWLSNSIFQCTCEVVNPMPPKINARSIIPVIVKDAATANSRPNIPQFNSHSRSFNRYLPDNRLLLPDDIVGGWCENNPSITRVYTAMMAAGQMTAMRTSAGTGTLSLTAYG